MKANTTSDITITFTKEEFEMLKSVLDSHITRYETKLGKTAATDEEFRQYWSEKLSFTENLLTKVEKAGYAQEGKCIATDLPNVVISY